MERAEVAAALWPDSQDEQARFNLRQTLSRLRKALGKAADHLEAPQRNTLRLHLSPLEADIAQFETATRRMDNASLEILASMPLRPLLEGWGDKEGEEWIEPERQARRKQRREGPAGIVPPRPHPNAITQALNENCSK